MSGPRLSIIPAAAVTDKRLKRGDLQVLALLGRHTNDQGWCCRSQVRMAQELDCARSTVQASLDRLYAAGYVQHQIQRSQSGGDAAHRYRVLLDTLGPGEHYAPSIVGPDYGDAEPAAPPCRQVGTPADISAPNNDPL